MKPKSKAVKPKPAQSQKLDKLAELLKDVEPERLQDVLTKGERINFRVTRAEKQQIEEIAEKLGLSISDYLLNLHRHVFARLK